MSHDRGCFQCGDDMQYYCGRVNCPNPAPPGAFKGEIRNARELGGLSRRPELNTFLDAMEAKLVANKDKLIKPKLPIPALLQLLRIEVEELAVAVQYQTPEEAMEECADVANFAMIVWKRLKASE